MRPKAPKNARVFENKRQKKQNTKRDTDNYIGYEAKDAHTEAGYALMNQFEAAAKGAVLDITGDDDATARAKKNQVRQSFTIKTVSQRETEFGTNQRKINFADALGRQKEEIRPRGCQRQEEDQDRERRVDPSVVQEQQIRQVEGEEQTGADAGKTKGNRQPPDFYVVPKACALPNCLEPYNEILNL